MANGPYQDLLKILKQFTWLDSDLCFLSDSDIIVSKEIDVWNEAQHAGVGGDNNGITHISGQLQIMRGDFINQLINITPYDLHILIQKLAKTHDVADDTFISYMSDL